ncbi:DUF2254 family protein [Marinobacter orientalis]|uniref:DUF2254 domain-containing protein n=1 Tax=Marinobacter orientalis TaxID=1928859 RepID=A0A7Y0RCV2_9GAMM|nr:DUF2254 family protein [Marinobacter orientalis]NMT63873.1 DUF2254 domain-containing protein [Marinobacter orientalis]TGX49973.1 DUF2254 domain-containing protein [Marinobacter orientalis]
MRQMTHRRPRRRRISSRIGEITLAMFGAMAAGLVVGLAVLTVDTKLLWPPPFKLGTIADARVVLGAVISGLITVAVFGLWMRTVVVGLMAAHFSPRTLLIFLEDRFQRNLLAFMAAGLVAVLVILLRMPTNEQTYAPLASMVLVVMIALAAMAGILLAIKHATRSLSLPELISRLAEDALDVLDRHPEARVELTEVPPPLAARRTVLAPGTGWVTGIDIDRIRKALPVGGAVHLRSRIGEFVTPRRPVALVSSTGIEVEEADFDAVAKAFTLARTRSPDMDLVFAVSQLVDVGTFALQTRADTSTAHEVMVHLEAVLEEIVCRGLPRLHDKDEDGRCVYDEAGWDAADLLQQCVERLREQASRDPEAARHLMHMLHRVREVAEGLDAFAVISEIECQVEMVRALAEANGMLPQDRQRLEREAKAIINRDSTGHIGHT